MASISIATMTLLSAGVLAEMQLFQWLSPAMWRVRKLSRCNSSTIDRYRGWSEDTKARSLAHGPLTTSPLIGTNPVRSRSETGTSRHAQASCKGSKTYKGLSPSTSALAQRPIRCCLDVLYVLDRQVTYSGAHSPWYFHHGSSFRRWPCFHKSRALHRRTALQMQIQHNQDICQITTWILPSLIAPSSVCSGKSHSTSKNRWAGLRSSSSGTTCQTSNPLLIYLS